MKPGDLARSNQHDFDYQGRTTKFFDMLFRLNGEDNRFITNKGILQIQRIELHIRKNPGSKAKDKQVEVLPIQVHNMRYLEEDIRSFQYMFISVLISRLSGGNDIFFICSLPKRSLNHKSYTLKLDDISKIQFGGQGPGGKKVNFGNEYEEKLAATYKMLSLGQDIEGKPWAKHVNVMNEHFENISGGGLSYCNWAGPQNTSRPLIEKDGGVVISSDGKTDGKIGETIQDIMVQYGGDAVTYEDKPDPNAKTYYISVKYGETLSFFNCGVQGKRGKESTAFFVHSDMDKDKIAPAGQTLLDMFNIDQQPFINIFKKWGKGGSGLSPHIIKTTLSKDQQTALEALIFSGVGYGYWMAHFRKGKFEFYEVDETYCTRASTLKSNKVELQYGGGEGTKKRINMIFSTHKYDFTYNIRNKQGAVWPSHTNGDYKINSQPPTL